MENEKELIASFKDRVMGGDLHNGEYIQVPQKEATQVLALIKEQDEIINGLMAIAKEQHEIIDRAFVTLEHAAIVQGKRKKGLKNGARP